MRFQLIEADKALLPMAQRCKLLRVSVSGYYAWKANQTYGAPRMYAELRDSGWAIGRGRVARLMRDNGLKARQRHRYKRTTDRTHLNPVAANLLAQDFKCQRPDQKWGADISYLWTSEGWLYLAIVLDLYSRRSVGWAVSERLKQDLALSALRRAMATREPKPGLIHHSDSKNARASCSWAA